MHTTSSSAKQPSRNVPKTAQGQQQQQASRAGKNNKRSTHHMHKTPRQHRHTSEGNSGDTKATEQRRHSGKRQWNQMAQKGSSSCVGAEQAPKKGATAQTGTGQCQGKLNYGYPTSAGWLDNWQHTETAGESELGRCSKLGSS